MSTRGPEQRRAAAIVDRDGGTQPRIVEIRACNDLVVVVARGRDDARVRGGVGRVEEEDAPAGFAEVRDDVGVVEGVAVVVRDDLAGVGPRRAECPLRRTRSRRGAGAELLPDDGTESFAVVVPGR